MKIIISGVTGFIGSTLCQKFLNMGNEVIGLGRKENEKIKQIKNKNFTFMKLNEMNIDKLKYADLFYHFAWNMDLANTKDNTLAWNTELSNLKMTCETLDLIVKAKVKKIVFCGSVSQEKYIFDSKRNLTDIKGSIYGITKQMASDIWKKISCDANINYNLVLLANTYGPNDLKTVCKFIKKIALNEELNLIEEDDIVDWVYIDDTIKGLISIGEKGKNMKTYYLGHRKINTFGEKIKDIKKILNSQSELNFGTFQETKGTNYSRIDLDSLYNDTGFECTYDFKEGILKIYEWLKKEGYLNE